MSQSDELLNQLAKSSMTHEHPVVNVDGYFIIDPDTRSISNVSGTMDYLMQKDHKSKRYTFELPRFAKGHDMSLCNRVYIHFINVDSETREERYDFAEITDLQVNPEDPSTVICTWLIERHATQLIGGLSFLVQYACVTDDGNMDYEFHTDWYSNVIVKKGRRDPDPIILEYTNLLEQWYQKIFGTGDGLLDGIEAARVEAIENVNSTAADRKAELNAESKIQQSAIEAKGQETIDSIPADYTETYRMAEEALRIKADAIADKVEGNPIVINDASDDHLLGLTLFGKTEQATTTGRNLLDVEESIELTNVLGVDVNLPTGEYVVTLTSETHSGDQMPHLRFYANNVWVSLKAGLKQNVVLSQEETMVYIYTYGMSASASVGVAASFEQLMISTDGGEYEPYTGGKASPSPAYPQELVSVENATVMLRGKNLIPNLSEYSRYGITVTPNSDGTVTINGTATNSYGLRSNTVYLPAGTYTLRCNHVLDANTWLSISNGPLMVFPGEQQKTYELESGEHWLYFYINQGVTFDNFVLEAQLEIGETATEYEPYKPVQTLTTQRTLRSLSDVQDKLIYDYQNNAWQYIQRTATVDLGELTYIAVDPAIGLFRSNSIVDGLSPSANYEVANILCTHYIPDYYYSGGYGVISRNNKIGFNQGNIHIHDVRYANCTVDEFAAAIKGVMLQYILAEPIIHELTTEEVLAFKALHTNKTNTVIQNGVGAHMEVTYAADTKTFITNTLRSVVKEILSEQ